MRNNMEKILEGRGLVKLHMSQCVGTHTSITEQVLEAIF